GEPEDDHHHALEQAGHEENRNDENNVFLSAKVTRHVEVSQASFQEETDFEKAQTHVLRDKNRERGDGAIRDERPMEISTHSLRGIAIGKRTEKPAQIQTDESDRRRRDT